MLILCVWIRTVVHITNVFNAKFSYLLTVYHILVLAEKRRNWHQSHDGASLQWSDKRSSIFCFLLKLLYFNSRIDDTDRWFCQLMHRKWSATANNCADAAIKIKTHSHREQCADTHTHNTSKKKYARLHSIVICSEPAQKIDDLWLRTIEPLVSHNAISFLCQLSFPSSSTFDGKSKSDNVQRSTLYLPNVCLYIWHFDEKRNWEQKENGFSDKNWIRSKEAAESARAK